MKNKEKSPRKIMSEWNKKLKEDDLYFIAYYNFNDLDDLRGSKDSNLDQIK